MLKTLVNAWKVADIRKKLLFTALIVLIFRIGSAIPVPFTNISDTGIISDPDAGTFMNYHTVHQQLHYHAAARSSNPRS